jgi:hypothetical protein
VCTAPSTPIATPQGERPISELRAGDLIYSMDRGQIAVVPIKAVHQEPVVGAHQMVEVRLAQGVTLRISPRHPTADGRQFGDIKAGDRLDGIPVLGATLVPYDQRYTYDILPDSDSGTYFAGGALIGSTLGTPSKVLAGAAGSIATRRRASLAPSATPAR